MSHVDGGLIPPTHATPEFLSAVWGQIEPELRRVLGRLVQPADIDDIVQEVFIRLAVRCERRPLPSEALVDLAKLAGWNLGLNAVRDAAVRAFPGGALPELPASTDVEEQAVWHLDLDRVLAAVADMSDADRSIIAEALSPARRRGESKREQDRMSLRLFRARSRLRARVAGVLTGLPIWRLRLRLSQEAIHAVASLGATVVVATVAGVWAPSSSRAPHPSPPVLAARYEPAAFSAPATEPPATARPASAHAQSSLQPAAASVVTPPSQPPAPVEAAPAPPARRTLAAVPHPAGGDDAATVHGSDRNDRVPLACVGGGPVGQAICIPHPLR